MPLDRALSKRRLASRSEARALIEAGRVRVDGKLVTRATTLVVPERIRVAIDGIDAMEATRPVGPGRRADFATTRRDVAAARGEVAADRDAAARNDADRRQVSSSRDSGERAAPPARAVTRIIAFHKPRGVLTTRRDPSGRRTVFDVLGEAGVGLVAIGRLDMASTGLLLLTNDTQLAHELTEPANRITRRYVVTVRGRFTADAARLMERGLTVPDGSGRPERLSATRVDIRKASGRETHLVIDLVEGRNREIRRMCEAGGHEVTRLHRIAFGPFALGGLQPGEWREVVNPWNKAK